VRETYSSKNPYLGENINNPVTRVWVKLTRRKPQTRTVARIRKNHMSGRNPEPEVILTMLGYREYTICISWNKILHGRFKIQK
jgi:hypothetical protein